jgi:hypothetical protein
MPLRLTLNGVYDERSSEMGPADLIITEVIEELLPRSICLSTDRGNLYHYLNTIHWATVVLPLLYPAVEEVI